MLCWAFYKNDFSVLYVANNSNSALPVFYRFAAVWGAHEGSLLLWALALSTWSLAVAAFSRDLPETFAARVLGVLGIVSIGFLLFILLTSNPFERLIPAAMDGRDLNPLLQDSALAMHPPILYMGYVGFCRRVRLRRGGDARGQARRELGALDAALDDGRRGCS